MHEKCSMIYIDGMRSSLLNGLFCSESMSTPNSPAKEVALNSLPIWLSALLDEDFFEPCVNHLGYKQNEKNIYCLDCCISFCTSCSASHFGHQVLQIRKYNEHRVVKTEDMERLLKCSLVQSYMLNRALVVFLKERSANKKKENDKEIEEKEDNQSMVNKKRRRVRKLHDEAFNKICATCPRSLKEEYEYCSITCMVRHLMKTKGNISGHLREFQLEEAESIQKVLSMNRRKGVPKRAPFC